jgi:YHS domain-containing protein
MTATSTEQNFVDPVCKMKVGRGSKVSVFVYESETYYFCAASCRDAFMADPQTYLKSKPNKRKGFWGRYLDRLNKATGGKPPCCH